MYKDKSENIQRLTFNSRIENSDVWDPPPVVKYI